MRKCIPLITVIFVLVTIVYTSNAESIAWINYLATGSEEKATGVSADGLGNVYVSGYSDGALAGPNLGSRDAFIVKYDAAGNSIWSRQFGTDSNDSALGISADKLGNVYTTGQTYGGLGGGNSGGGDAFVAKYDAGGNLLWTAQLGSPQDDSATSASADGMGNVYVAGTTGYRLGPDPNLGFDDAFVSKFDSSGNLEWTHQLGSFLSDMGAGVSADGLGNVYVAGQAYGLAGADTYAGGGDAFVAKYDASGNVLWERQLGTSDSDWSNSVSADGFGNVYVAGDTYGDLAGPHANSSRDAFLAKYDAAGNLLWKRQFGTGADESFGIAADHEGNVYITGYAPGSGPFSGRDATVSKYDAAGNLLWTRNLGVALFSSASGLGVSVDGYGGIYTSGYRFGGFNGADALIAKISDVPEPSSLALMTAGSAILWVCRQRRNRWPRNGGMT